MTERALRNAVLQAALKFYVGLHHPGDAQHFDRACVSVRALRGRKKPIACSDVLLDSGAFTELHLHGKYQHAPSEYAAEVRRLVNHSVISISAAVSQDYMCEPFMLAKTGLTVAEHHRLTIDRYDDLLRADLPVPVMPVLQGYAPSDYCRHMEMYGNRLRRDAWVGVGSVCKRNSVPERIIEVLYPIKRERPDLRLHGFGVKKPPSCIPVSVRCFTPPIVWRGRLLPGKRAATPTIGERPRHSSVM